MSGCVLALVILEDDYGGDGRYLVVEQERTFEMESIEVTVYRERWVFQSHGMALDFIREKLNAAQSRKLQ